MPSSVVAHMDYNAEAEILRITYTSGNVYDYLKVSEKEVKEMKAASSKGRYLNFFIKPKHKYRKVR